MKNWSTTHYWTFYRPERSCEGHVFTGVCLSTGGCLPQCMLGYHTHPRPREQIPLQEQIPPWGQTPPGSRPPRSRHTPPTTREQTPPRSRYPPGGRHPLGADRPGADTPQEQTTPERTSTRADTPLGADTPQEQTPPRSSHPPPPRDGHCCGRYASYWNAFLLVHVKINQVSSVNVPTV